MENKNKDMMSRGMNMSQMQAEQDRLDEEREDEMMR